MLREMWALSWITLALAIGAGTVTSALAEPPAGGEATRILEEIDALESEISALRGGRKASALRRVRTVRRLVRRQMGAPTQRPKPLPAAMSEADFEAVYIALDQAPSDEARLKVIAEASADGAFTVAQVSEAVGRFAFSDEQIAAMTLLIPRVVDPEQGYRLFQLFPRAEDRQAVRRILESARKERRAAKEGP